MGDFKGMCQDYVLTFSLLFTCHINVGTSLTFESGVPLDSGNLQYATEGNGLGNADFQ